MSQVRRTVQDTWHTLQRTEAGAVRIAARVIAALARDTARLVPGVALALGRSTAAMIPAITRTATSGRPYPHAPAGVLGRTAVVDLAITVSWDKPARQVARHIQRQVIITTVRASTGLRDLTVNVTVDDILSDDS